MGTSLRFISISHKTASIALREEYHIPEIEKDNFVKLISNTFPDIVGLLLLVTCNRTEIYFESTSTSDVALRDFLISQKSTINKEQGKQLFKTANNSEETVKHLLEVSSGLKSSVLGDAEIVHQIKKAYQYTIVKKLQGSLLERALQTVFKGHKRISNETHFRDGTTSVAYKSLKVISSTFGKASAKTKKILFIGAGDIVLQLFKYNSKFNFSNISISNRTEAKAKALAHRYQCGVYAWNKVLANDFNDFDIIISAASNCPLLVEKIPLEKQKTLLLDLALPCNIDKSLAKQENILFYDLDAISNELENNQEKRLAAIGKVKMIIDEELDIYGEWLREAPLRALLAYYKIVVNKKVTNYFETHTANFDKQDVKIVTNRVIRKIHEHQIATISPEEIDAIVAEKAASI
jgi:glutamyl-tRNA reductase